MALSPLPPLPSLIAFEAAARTGSFTRAANELNLSQSAISRQIAQLETFLGRALFVRAPHALRLTQGGERYAREVRALLTQCADATADLIKGRSDLDLTVACSSGVAVLWMAKRISAFRAHYPEARIRLIVRDGLASLSPTEFDVAVFYLRGAPAPGLASRQLYAECVLPVCAPGYLGGRRLRPDEIADERLLILDDGQRQWMSWEKWFDLNGVAPERYRKPRNPVVVNYYPLLVQLAMQGEGIVLGWGHMIDACLNEGSLVAASDATASLGGGYSLIWPDDRRESLAEREFKRWLIETVESEARASSAAIRA
ncbi:LysR substrate-binding domain-containing protein [Chitinasiproducens palmae]|uniref:DNA-binding transcriptional regulator, LysR family n=1 Tax=Chitinasiproducens palmae TaxID=1770053 RepID=A0A1H2PN28_9BURK|nr:LysR substrate-binding domain-containing protein [Chitinasiproducens palmae]SDV48070.1 DNA-binding transcriptional regulator, LysR family [Chitinasiproducens palmae]